MTESGELIAPTADDRAAAEEEAPEEEDYDEVQPEQEAADLKVASAPVKPTAAVVEEHRITHYPYRSWCDECREGRGLGEQRGRHVGRPHDIPRVGIDYWYITSGGLQTRKELGEEFPEGSEGDQAVQKAREDLKVMKCLIDVATRARQCSHMPYP